MQHTAMVKLVIFAPHLRRGCREWGGKMQLLPVAMTAVSKVKQPHGWRQSRPDSPAGKKDSVRGKSEPQK